MYNIYPLINEIDYLLTTPRAKEVAQERDFRVAGRSAAAAINHRAATAVKQVYVKRKKAKKKQRTGGRGAGVKIFGEEKGELCLEAAQRA